MSTPSTASTTSSKPQRIVKLAPEVNKIIFVRNLPYKITDDELYQVFARFGQVRQIRKGAKGDKKGTAFIVYDDIYDAKDAV
jgi:pre-mRNA branch site protein p14